MTSTKTSDVPGVVSDAIVRQLAFFSGIPAEDGYYLVELDQPGLSEDRSYDVDYCRAKAASDGGGREWVKWYPHNVRRWARLPNIKVSE